MTKRSVIAVSLLLLTGRAANADELTAMNQQLRALAESVQELRSAVAEQAQVIQTLRSSAPPAPPAAVPAPASASGKSVGQYLPDIGFVADIAGTLSQDDADEEGNDRLSVREVELVLGHDIDPYSRLDATITFSDFEEPDIEETYISYWGLPLELKGKIGRMRQRIGKASAIHRDSLETVDEPLVVQHYLGIEGLFRTGVELSGFTPLSGDSFVQQLTAGVMEGGAGEDGLLFGEVRRHPSYYAHLSNFIELGDTTSFELGGTYLAGDRDDDQTAEVHAFGVDATLAHNFDTIRKIKLQSEGYFQDRGEAVLEDEEDNALDGETHPAGFYVLADYRFDERWGAGTRYDYVEPIDNPAENPRNDEQAISAYLTFYQSEFARWRAQYEYARLVEGGEDNRFFLQGTFAIGTHKHNLQW